MILGTMASESVRRQSSYLKPAAISQTRSNFPADVILDRAVMFWPSQNDGISYASVYYEIVEEAGKLTTTGVKSAARLYVLRVVWRTSRKRAEPVSAHGGRIQSTYNSCIHKLRLRRRAGLFAYPIYHKGENSEHGKTKKTTNRTSSNF